MKAPKKFSLFIFFSLFLATILSVMSCRFDLLNAESEKELEEALSTPVHFYSCEEGGPVTPVIVSKRIQMGVLHNSSDFLSGSELSSLSGGGAFLGYKFYRMTQSGSTVRPSYVQVNSDEYITNSFVSVDEMDFVTDWGVNYRVNHFLQNTDGTTYPSTPYLTQTLSARTGENSNAAALTGSDIAGFTYDASSSDSLVQPVAEDGSTVINLYYTRNMIYLTLNKNGGNIGGNSSDITIRGRYGASTASAIAEALPSNPVQTGKVFAGWEPPLPETFPASGTSYSVVWASKLYNIAFNSNGGSGSMATHTNRVYETEYTLPANTFTKATSDGTAYQFYGWNTQADGNGASYAGGASVSGSIFESGGTAIENGDTVTLYAQWNIPYTVKHMFQNLDGTYTENTSFRETKYAAKNAETLAQAKSGTDIAGYSALAITQQNVSTDGSTVIEVKYNRNTVTLTFELEGGNVSGSTADVTISGTYGQTIDTSSIPAPVYAGKALSGWNPSVPATFPAVNSTYKAVWDSSKYNVAFDSNGGTGSMSSLTNCLYESEFDLPANTFTRISASSYGSRNYKFDHWNTASDNSGTTYSAGQTVSMLTPEDGGTVTLYAIWRVPYRVQHYHQNADSPSSYSLVNSGTQILYGFAGDTTAAVAKTYTGFVTPDTVAQTTIAEDGSTEVRINYNRQTFTVTYEDGVDDEEITVPTSASYRYEQSVNVTFTPSEIGSRTGYTFSGWSDGTETYTSTGITSFTMPNSAVTLTAQWTPVTYQIVYNNAEEYWNPFYTHVETYTIEDSVTLPVSAKFYRTGYNFAGWYDNEGLTGDTKTTIPLGSTGTKTYWAKWNIIEYTITYNLDGGTNGSNPTTYTVNSANITLADATKDNYVFGGWYTDLSDESTKVETIVTSSPENKTLYAKWLPVYATVDGVNYGNKATTIAAIEAASGTFEVVLTSHVTAGDLGKADTNGTIINAIKAKDSATDRISLSLASGNTITLGSDCGIMFYNCGSLVSIDFTGFDTSNVTNMQNMFNSCNKLSSVDFTGFNTSNVTNMYSMFCSCRGLVSLDLKSFATGSVTSMKQMFFSCDNLETIYVSSAFTTASVTDSYEMFYYCLKLKGGTGTQYDGGHVDATYARIDGGTSNPGYFTLKTYTADNICDSIRALGTSLVSKASFALTGECTADNIASIKDALLELKSADSSKTVNLDLSRVTGFTALATDAFKECSNLISVELPDTVTSIGGSAFFNCTKLETINIPDGVISIGGNCFWMCYALKSITIPSGVTSLVYRTFYACHSLTELTIPGTVRTIDSQAFNGCSGIETLVLEEGILSIGAGAFFDSDKLTSVTIPASVTRITGNPFGDCNRLTSITFTDPTGWKDGNGDALDLTDSANNKTLLNAKEDTEVWTKE